MNSLKKRLRDVDGCHRLSNRLRKPRCITLILTRYPIYTVTININKLKYRKILFIRCLLNNAENKIWVYRKDKK